MSAPAPLRDLSGGTAALCAGGVCAAPDPRAEPDRKDTMNSSISAERRFEVLDVVYRYATGIDTRDWDLFRTVFTDDAQVDFGFARWESGDAFTEFMRETHDPAGRTLHRMTNTVITGVEPLAARTYGDAVVLRADNLTGTIANAWYDDAFVQTEAGLRIRRRIVRMGSMVGIGPNLAPTL